MSTLNNAWTEDYVHKLINKLEDCRNSGLKVSEALSTLENDPEVGKSANAIRKKLNLAGKKFFIAAENKQLKWGSHFTHGHIMKTPAKVTINKPTTWTEELIIKTICVLFEYYSKNFTVSDALFTLGDENTLGKSTNAIRKKFKQFGNQYFIFDGGEKLKWGEYFTTQKKSKFRTNKKTRILWTEEEKNFILNEIENYPVDDLTIDETLLDIKNKIEQNPEFTTRTKSSIGGILFKNNIFTYNQKFKRYIWNDNYSLERELKLNQDCDIDNLNFEDHKLIRSIHANFNKKDNKSNKLDGDLYDVLSNADYDSDVDLFGSFVE